MKLNKHISFVLALLLLVSNIGLAFNVHYCGDELAGISFDYKNQELCVASDSPEMQSCCAETETDNDCCSNDKIDLKKSISDEVIVKSFQLDLPAFTLVDSWKPISFEAAVAAKFTRDTPSFYCESNAPPLYKLHCQYIFYDTF